MSQFDSEIDTLKKRISELEEQKRMYQAQNAGKPASLRVLEQLIVNKKKKIEMNLYSKRPHVEPRVSDQEKIAMLEPIYAMFKVVFERLEQLETKS